MKKSSTKKKRGGRNGAGGVRNRPLGNCEKKKRVPKDEGNIEGRPKSFAKKKKKKTVNSRSERKAGLEDPGTGSAGDEIRTRWNKNEKERRKEGYHNEEARMPPSALDVKKRGG